MAADIAAILADIESCFDFAGRSVVHVGAGGGQFVGYATRAARVLAVDPEPTAVERLRAALRERGLEHRVTVRQGDLMDVRERADVSSSASTRSPTRRRRCGTPARSPRASWWPTTRRARPGAT